MQKLTILALSLLSMIFPSATPSTPSKFNKDEALKALIDGNTRYINNASTCVFDFKAARLALVEAQTPLAVIVGCSDSRVPPEIIFDLNLGKLFVVRIAGNIVGNIGLGSIEYAVEYLKTPLIMVLGHENCGAVNATISGTRFEDSIESIVNTIRPAVDAARKKEGNLLKNAVQENVRRVATHIQEASPGIDRLIKEGTVQIVGGYYELDTGKVILLEL